MCCTRLAAIQDAKNRHFGTIWHLCWAVSSQLRHISTIGKNLLNTDSSSTCPYNVVNFGLLTAKICWQVCGHPCKFQRVSHLGSVTARHSSSGRQPNFAAFNRGRHRYLAGRPSRWALAHILVCLWSCPEIVVLMSSMIVKVISVLTCQVVWVRQSLPSLCHGTLWSIFTSIAIVLELCNI